MSTDTVIRSGERYVRTFHPFDLTDDKARALGFATQRAAEFYRDEARRLGVADAHLEQRSRLIAAQGGAS